MEGAVEVILQVNINSCSVSGWDSLEAEEVEVALDAILNIKDDVDDISFPEYMKGSEVNQDYEASSRIIKNQKKLGKSATFPSAETHSVSSLGSEGSTASGNQSCPRALSLPSSFRLVSALKGGRVQQGLPPKAKTNVTWAADVYDPPTTSVSHMVSGHSQRKYYRSTKRKENYKHKHKKGSKSIRGGNGKRSVL